MRLVSTLCLLACLGYLSMTGATNPAWASEQKPLAVLAGRAYTAEDYLTWWRYWRDDEKQKPATIEPYLDWLLMVEEAQRMELEGLPEFKHKVRVFLEARSLMLLKNEAIDRQIVITDAELKAAYDRDYAPRRLVGALEFSGETAAKDFARQQAGQTLTLEQLQMLAAEGPKPPFAVQSPQWLRPVNTPAPWRPLLTGAVAGSLHGPLPLGDNKTALLFVAEVKAADGADFEHKKEVIKTDLRKNHEGALTAQLVKSLRAKFHVRVNEEVLDKINLAPGAANDLDQVLIASDRSQVTVGYFLDQARRETDITGRLPTDGAAQTQMKRRLVNTMIANSLVAWEALDRHYEESEPLRGVYQFYRQNRLVAELSARATGDNEVSEAEIADYYQTHGEEFSQPEAISGLMVAGEAALIQAVWAEAIAGADLGKAAETRGAKVLMQPATPWPLGQFSEAARQTLARLKNGELSQPFLDNGQTVVLKLIERRPPTVAPLNKVAATIKGRLSEEKRAKGKQALLASLRAKSSVVVNDEVWQGLLRQEP